MAIKQDVDRIVAADTLEATWLHFGRLASPTLCQRMIEKRAPNLSATEARTKAEGVASAIRSAHGYWRTHTPTLNARILTRYYALLQVSIAEQVSSPDPSQNLDSVQRHTEQGHGFAAVQSPNCDFPDNYNIACMQSGHLAAYAKARQLDLSGVSFDKRPRTWTKLDESERAKLLSLSDLLLRVPELQRIAPECLGKPALSFHVGHARRNLGSGLSSRALQAPGTRTTTHAALYADTTTIKVEWLESLGLPFSGFTIEEDKPTQSTHFVGALEHPASDLWWDHFPHYKSDYCGTSVIVPFWGITDPFILHLGILYALSIVVRYLPSVWHRVEHGNLDHVRALIEHYLSILDNVGPQLALERVTQRRLVATTPGSFNSPI